MESSLEKILRLSQDPRGLIKLHGIKGEPGYSLLHSPHPKVREAANKVFKEEREAGKSVKDAQAAIKRPGAHVTADAKARAAGGTDVSGEDKLPDNPSPLAKVTSAVTAEPEKKSTAWRTEKVRRTRAEVEPIADVLAAEFTKLNPGVEFHFGGSYRRGAPTVGDLDMVIITSDGKLDKTDEHEAIQFPPSVTLQRGKGKIAQGDITVKGVTMHVDFWSAPENERGAFLWFITGPKELNVAMRADAKKKGLNLSQGALMQGGTMEKGKLTGGKQIDDGTEKDVAEKLGGDWIKYLDPLTRQSFAPASSSAPDQSWTVKSSDGKSSYTVSLKGGKYVCTCTGFKYRGKCKHITEIQARK